VRRIAHVCIVSGLLAAPSQVTSAAPGAAPTAEDTDPPPDAEGPRPVAILLPLGTDPALLEAITTATTHLDNGGIELQPIEISRDISPVSYARSLIEEENTAGVFWLSSREPDKLRVLLLTAGGKGFIREVPVEADSPEASREAVWLIVVNGSRALASGEALAMAQASLEDLGPPEEPKPEEPKLEPPDEPKPEDPPPEPPPKKLGGGLAALYTGEGIGAPVPWQSGVGLSGFVDPGRLARVTLDYGLFLPWRSDDPVVTWRHQLLVRGGLRGDFGKFVTLHGLLGVGIEAVRWRGTLDDRQGWRAWGTASADVGLQVRLGGPAWLWIEAGGAALLNPFTFIECEADATQCEGDTRRVSLQPWGFRPRARAGVALRF